jgi:lipoate-protein ligase B
MPACKIISYPQPISYADALVEQYRLQDELLAGTGTDKLLLLEHTPTITVGRGSLPTDLLRSREDLKADGIDVVDTDRGGEITYHCPGQLVAYPILNLEHYGRDLHAYLRNLEEVIIQTIGHFGIEGHRDPGFTGVWTGSAPPLPSEERAPSPQGIIPVRGGPGEGLGVRDRKIAAIGIKARRWVTMHGIALNIDDDLTPFRRDFVPCGISDRGVTSITEELRRRGQDSHVDRSQVEPVFVDAFRAIFDC